MDKRYLLCTLFLVLIGCQPIEDDFSEWFVDYSIPGYFQRQLIEKEEIIERMLFEYNDVSSFIFFTDAHWEINAGNSPEIIRYIQDKTGIDYLFFGGDAINGSADKDNSLSIAYSFTEAFSRFNHFYPVYGNHDSNKITANLEDRTKWFSDEEVYSYLHNTLRTKSNVHYGDYFYYYVDDSTSTTRYLCLDTGKNNISKNELVFIADALVSTPQDWHIIFVTHIVYNETNLYDPGTVFIPERIKPMIAIAEAFNAKRLYQIDGNTECDFSNATNRVDFIIGGHIHRDYIGYSEEGIPLISIDCDCLHTYSSVGNRRGTINEQCITAVVADFDNDMIHLVRVGRGSDMEIPIVNQNN